MSMTLAHLITTYNYAHLLPQHLAGVLAQTRRPDVVVVSDDASPKDTPEAVRSAAALWPGAEVRIAAQNQGSALHVQRLINSVTTDVYIAMSADDWLVDPKFFADAMAILEHHPDIVAVFGYHQAVDPHGRPLAPVAIESAQPWTRLEATAFRQRMALDNLVSGVCTMVRVRRRLPIPAYPIRNEYCTDWLHYYLLTLSGDYARVNRIVCNYRVQSEGLYLVHTQSGLSVKRHDEGYAALLAWPDLNDSDRAWLRYGRTRRLLRGSRLRALPGVVARNAMEPATWTLLGETLAERTASRITQWARNLQRRTLPPAAR